MVMEPAQGRQIVWLVGPAVDIASEVMRLEPIPARTTISHTPTITMRHKPANRSRDRPRRRRRHHPTTPRQTNDLHRPSTQQLVEHRRADPRPILRTGTEFTARPVSSLEIHQHRHRRTTRRLTVAAASIEGIHRHRYQTISSTLPPGAHPTTRHQPHLVATPRQGTFDDLTIDSRELTRQTPRRLIKRRLDRHKPIHKHRPLIATRHPALRRRQPTNTGQVKRRRVFNRATVRTRINQTQHRHRPIEPDLAGKQRPPNPPMPPKPARCEHQIRRHQPRHIKPRRHILDC